MKEFSSQSPHKPPTDQQNNTPEAVEIDSGSVSVSSDCGRKITRKDIEIVQNLIERCLQLYMNRNEVVNTLFIQAKIEPNFTTLVWQKLEEENADFFRAYYVRLLLKKQIVEFNRLLEHQYQVMNYPVSPKFPLASTQNGIQHIPVNKIPMGYPPLQQPLIPPCHSQLDSDGSMSYHVVNGIPASSNFHALRMSSGKECTADTVSPLPTIKSEMDLSPASVASNGQCSFNPTEISELTAETSPFNSTYASHITTAEGLQLGPSCGAGSSTDPFSGIPWNFSFTDLAADLTNVEEHGQLTNYSGSDLLLDSPRQNDEVEEFFVDNYPAPDSLTEEKSSDSN